MINEPQAWIFTAQDQVRNDKPWSSREVVEARIKDLFWGASPETRNFKHLNEGDVVIFYAGKSSKSFIGSALIKDVREKLSSAEQNDLARRSEYGGAVSGVILEDAQLWDVEVPVATAVPGLNFIEKKENWQSYFQGSFIRIPVEDAGHIFTLGGNTISMVQDSEQPTDVNRTVKGRIGQQVFRKKLIQYWNSSCAVTSLSHENILVASHIKPWRECSNGERLDTFNGLLLTPNLDRLFDRFLISFSEEDGSIIVSEQISEAELSKLGINREMKLRRLEPEHKSYLKTHRSMAKL